jgi:hypothetical protein
MKVEILVLLILEIVVVINHQVLGLIVMLDDLDLLTLDELGLVN